MLPHSAPSVAICTGSWMTAKPASGGETIPSRPRCACHTALPMLRWPHDHHRDIRALASAPRTTALHAANRETFAVTRHGLPQFPAAVPSLRSTIEFAPSVVSDAQKPPLVSDAHRQRHPIHRQFSQIASRPALPTADRDFATLSRKQKYP